MVSFLLGEKPNRKRLPPTEDAFLVPKSVSAMGDTFEATGDA
jgi:hypothetical protein